jgi:hypothetical protein
MARRILLRMVIFGLVVLVLDCRGVYLLDGLERLKTFCMELITRFSKQMRFCSFVVFCNV